jgi:hypothetical protein
LYRVPDLVRDNVHAYIGDVEEEFVLVISVLRRKNILWVFVRANSCSGWTRWDISYKHLKRISEAV